MKSNTIFAPVFLLSFALFTASCTFLQKRTPQSAEPLRLHIEALSYDSRVPLVNTVALRSGYIEPKAGIELKGCVQYLQGLGDSMLNHEPFFRQISDAGYRVILFDYMGQGGSEGSMNHTRIYDPLYKNLEIASLAKAVWNRYSVIKNNGRDCSVAKKVVIGWSTGGLASYRMARNKQADAVVLLAPGINPRTLVGEAASRPQLLVSASEAVITERTLTRQNYSHRVNPHVDPIKPASPTHVPLFAANLVLTSKLAQHWSIPREVPGLVFLSGDEDTYVDRTASITTLQRNAPHFTVISYNGALHELDNETDDVAFDVHRRTVDFINRINGH